MSSHAVIKVPLVGVPKPGLEIVARRALELLALLVRLVVLPLEEKGENSDAEDVADSAGDAGVQAGPVPGLVLVAEDEAARDAADAAHSDEGSAAKGAFPLAADVVGLVRHDGRDVRVGASGA